MELLSCLEEKIVINLKFSKELTVVKFLRIIFYKWIFLLENFSSRHAYYNYDKIFI